MSSIFEVMLRDFYLRVSLLSAKPFKNVFNKSIKTTDDDLSNQKRSLGSVIKKLLLGCDCAPQNVYGG